MNFKPTIAALALALSMTAPALAQSIVGQGSVNGRNIVIKDDFTWSYAETGNVQNTSDCYGIHGPYAFCGKGLGWTVTNKLSPDAAASFRLDDRNYAAVIREGLGTNDGFSLDFMQTAMIENLATAAGLGKQDIPVYAVDDFALFGIPARRVIYGGKISGLDVIYYNTVWVSDVETIQFFSFTIGKEPTDQALQLHNDAIAAVIRQ